MKFLIKIFYDVCNTLHNRGVSLLIVLGGFNEYNFVDFVECYDEETNEWKEVARTNENVDKVILSYQPCVPDIYENFPF